MSPRRRIALPLTAGAAALALVLASCSSSEPQPDPTEETSTEPSVSLRLPDGFDNQAPMWSAITDLPLGDILYSDISNDGQFYGYAALRNETLSIRQVNLPTGQRTEALEVPRLSGVQEPELGGWASLSYQDDQLVLTQAGHTVDETNSERDPEHTTAHLRVDIFEVGKSSDPTTLEKDSPEKDTTFKKADDTFRSVFADEPSRGDPTYYVLDAQSATFATYSSEDLTASPAECGQEDCSLDMAPATSNNGQTIATYKERPPNRVEDECGSPPEGDPLSGCLRGFGSDQWQSYQDGVAPEGALARTAILKATGQDLVLGLWLTDDEHTRALRLFDPEDPKETLAAFSCDRQGPSQSPSELHRSGPYVYGNSILINTDTGEGRCFSDDTHLKAVDDTGTAWGYDLSTDEDGSSSGANTSYVSSVITATLDGGIEEAGTQVAVPQAFTTVDGQQVGVFAVSGDELPNSTVLAAYPYH